MAGTAAGVAKARAAAKKANKLGRPKGSASKFTNLKNSFLAAYNAKDGFGGDAALKKWAKANPSEFLQMIKSMLPKEVAATIDDKRDPPDVTLYVGKKCRKI